MINQAQTRWSDKTLRTIPRRFRHGCGGPVGRAELVSGSEAVSSRPVRKVVLRK